jgi:putative cell wall-binding protein
MIKRLLLILSLLATSSIPVLSQNVERGPTGAVGGGGPVATPAPCLKAGAQILDAELSRCLINEVKLSRGPFYTLTKSIAPVVATMGRYTPPSNPLVQAALPRPLDLPTPTIYENSAELILSRFTFARSVILARGDLVVDSMAAVALAKAEDIPILLTEPNVLPEATLNVILKLRPQKIIIIGGEVAVSRAVEEEISQLNLAEVTRIWGESRFETAVELARQVRDPEVVVITDGIDPSLDAIFVSAEYKAPLLYVNGPFIPDSVRQFLLEHREVPDGGKLKVVTVGINDRAHTEIKALIDLPEFLSQVEAVSDLYKLIMKLISPE